MSYLKKTLVLLFFSFIAFLFLTPSVKAQPCGEFCDENQCNPGLGCSAHYPPANPNGTCVSSYAGACPSCTGNITGGIGACESAVNCSNPLWREGGDSLINNGPNPNETCNDWQAGSICCVPQVEQGTGECMDTCNTTPDCVSGMTCLNNRCVADCADCYCSVCTGNSGFTGACMNSATCADGGHNNQDGSADCVGGYICCTDAPQSTDCQLTAPNPFPINTNNLITLTSNTPNVVYGVNTTGSGNCSCDGDLFTTDGSGNGSFTCDCNPGGASITITTETTGANCSVSVVVYEPPDPTSCNIYPDIPFGPGKDTISLRSSIPNENYWLTGYYTSDSGNGICDCDVLGYIATDPSGNGNVNCSCGPVGAHVSVRAESFTTTPEQIICTGYFVVADPANPNPPQPQQVFCDPETKIPTEVNTGCINTAIGCIRIAYPDGEGNLLPDELFFVRFIIPWSLGIAGGIGIMLIALAGLQFATSGGNQERVAGAKEMMAAAISGLLLLGLAVFVLRFLGQNILQIPGL